MHDSVCVDLTAGLLAVPGEFERRVVNPDTATEVGFEEFVMVFSSDHLVHFVPGKLLLVLLDECQPFCDGDCGR